MFRQLLLTALLAGASAASAQQVHVVQQVDLTFSPAEITIAVGDTVRWVHTSGTHTVTNGASSTAADAGALFDVSLTASTPVFDFVFTEPGDVPYFCRPHEFFDMKGVVHVESVGTAAETPARAGLRVAPIRPNPFNPRASIRFALERKGAVTVTIHDARGRLVRRLSRDRSYPAGEHSLLWDGRDDRGGAAASGVYLFRVIADGQIETVRAALVR